MITILGPTACGKTRLAVALAASLHTEIISGDSRQVYRKMDIGTGKDLTDYIYNGGRINYHLIDIAEPGSKYTVFHFQHDFLKVYDDMLGRGLEPIFCGGSGLYLESVLRSYRLSPVPANAELRHMLEGKTLEELAGILASYKSLHNSTDIDTPQRAIRAIEIEEFYRGHQKELRPFPAIPSLNIGIDVSRELRRQRITSRLYARIENEGLVDEVRHLLDSGISPEDLIYYGLEYKYVTLFVIGCISYDEMLSSLEIAIHQFAKRQMTWFRGMERRGINIHWINGEQPFDDCLHEALRLSDEYPR